jgi:hypothetical protein
MSTGRSPVLNLRLGQEGFRVKKTQLLEKVGLFQDCPGLLGSEDYKVETLVPREHFEAFVGIIEGSPITISESNCESFWLLGEEFRFELLSAACTAFQASREPEVSEETSNSIEIFRVSKPRVTITVAGHSRTYETLLSDDEAFAFAMDLAAANETDINLEGIEGRDRLMEKAVEAIYLNTVASFDDLDAAKPSLALILWTIQYCLSSHSIDSTLYCLNRLHEIAPTAFEKARLLLLSQWEIGCRSGWDEVPTNFPVVNRAIRMLEEDKNGQRKQASEFLKQMKDSGRFSAILGKPDGMEQLPAPSGSVEPVSNQRDRTPIRPFPNVSSDHRYLWVPPCPAEPGNAKPGDFSGQTRAF